MSNKGFTMIEMVLAVFLGSMIILALVAIFSTTSSWFKWSFRQNVIQGGTLLSFDYISRDLEQTAALASPGTPCPDGYCGGSTAKGSDTLTGCTNYDTVNGAMYDSNQNMRVYSYCVDASGNMWDYWLDGSNLACPPNITGTCGTTMQIDGGGKSLQLAQKVIRDSTNNNCAAACSGKPCYFCRPANANNQVELHYWVSETQSTTTVHVNATVATEMTVFSPAP